jgi:hypothetical protein
MQRATTFTRSNSSLKHSSSIQLPNLVLAGAPKCGTSSLFNWLAAHPEVSGSMPKETFYFMDEDHPLTRPEANYHTHGLDCYQFFPEQSSAKILVEATTHYIYQQTALNFFAACDSQPYLIFILRKPSTRIFSSFSYTQNNLARLDQTISFAHFTDLLLNHKIDQIQENFHGDQSFFVLQHDLLYSQYYDFLIRWAERFSPNRFKIILFEQLKTDPKAVVTSIAQDLGIDTNFYSSFNFQQKNQTLTIRNTWLHRSLRQFAPSLPSTKLKTSLKSLYFHLQRQPIPTKSANYEALERLDRYFEPYNQKLEQEFNLDLSAWRK